MPECTKELEKNCQLHFDDRREEGEGTYMEVMAAMICGVIIIYGVFRAPYRYEWSVYNISRGFVENGKVESVQSMHG